MGLYSEKIEALIKAALADGELTDKERQVLIRKAAEEGIDQDEFEMVLNARLYEVQKDRKHQTESTHVWRKNNIRTCPNCGATIGGNLLTCPECGFAFVNESATSESVRNYLELFDKELQLIQPSFFNLSGNNKRISKISSISIPNTKEALIQAIFYCAGKFSSISRMAGSNLKDERKAWKAMAIKFYDMLKAQPNIDESTQQFISQYSYLKEKGSFFSRILEL